MAETQYCQDVKAVSMKIQADYFVGLLILVFIRRGKRIADTGVLFLPPSDVYVRSFLYLLYTLIKLYYKKKKKE